MCACNLILESDREKQKENKMTNNERIAKWVGVRVEEVFGVLRIILDDGSFLNPWLPNEDITLWHGENGLLSKIEERGEDFVCDFIFELDIDLLGTDDMWECDLFAAIRATPEQLTTALVAAINEDRL